jgi:hypothetical protein
MLAEDYMQGLAETMPDTSMGAGDISGVRSAPLESRPEGGDNH